MEYSHGELTACCGLYCGDCVRYRSEASRLASDLLAELDRLRFEKYAAAKSASVEAFGRYGDFRRLLAAIRALRCDVPCRSGGDGCGEPCEIKRCAAERSFQGCWECEAFEACRRFDFLEAIHGEGAKANLRKIRKHGLERWAAHREKCYPWL